VLADESVFTPTDALHVAANRVADLVSIKIMKPRRHAGRAQDLGDLRGRGIACYGGDMFETGIAHLAGTHLIAATPNIYAGLRILPGQVLPRARFAAEPFPIENGRVVVPGHPGLASRSTKTE
jgi:muconate cycloisomerase